MEEPTTYQFADLHLDTGRRQLSRGKEPVELTKLSFNVLQALVEAAPNLLSHDELINKVWGSNRVISPENLAQRVTMLRQGLGDEAQHPVYIETVYGQGFRLIPEVTRIIHGVAGTGDSVGRAAKVGLKKRTRNVGLALVLAAILAGTAIMLWRGGSSDGELPKIDLTQGPSVAVLPFVNMSDDPNNEFFSDGISEEIINTLVLQTNLQVIARTSSFQFKDRAIGSSEIGRLLRATHLIEGSVRKTGDQVRITAQLIDSPSGVHLWSNQYDRPIENLFVIQTEISANIVAEIKRQLVAQGEERIQSAFTYSETIPRGKVNPAAYEAYLKGLQHRSKLLPDDLTMAIDLFEEAIRLQPDFLETWIALIDSQLLASQVHFLLLTPAQVWSSVDQFLEAAEQYDFIHPRISLHRGQMLALNEYRWQEGMAQIAQSIPKLQNDAEALAMAGFVYQQLEMRSQAKDLIGRAYRLNPGSPTIQFATSVMYAFDGRQQDGYDVLQSDQWPYYTAISRLAMNWFAADAEDMDRNVRMAEKHVGPDYVTVRTFRAELLRLQGDREAAWAIGKVLVAEMEEQPMFLGWGEAGRTARAIAIAERQRQYNPLFWLMQGPGNLREPYYSIYFKKLKLTEFPADTSGKELWRSKDEQGIMLDSAVSMPASELQRYAGSYRSSTDDIRVYVEDDLLRYRSRFVGSRLIPMGDNNFASLTEADMEAEFFINESGEVDLCIWREGQLVHYGYRFAGEARID